MRRNPPEVFTMKHNLPITVILISMFLITQLIGLAVIDAYTPEIEQVEIDGQLVNVTTNPIPYNLDPPETNPNEALVSIIIAFIIAILFVFILTKVKAAMFIRLWFLFVVTIVVGITLNALFSSFLPYSFFINEFVFSIPAVLAIAIAFPLALFKIFKQNVIIHNLTELMIYPGIAVVFIPLLNIWTIIILLIIISLYDMWAVWHSGFMQKMANFQINELKIFGGFFVPYLNKSQRKKIKLAKQEYKKSGKKPKTKSMKVNLAILGGGDVVFPIITAGVVFRSIGLLPALVVILGATIALSLLFYKSQKGKFYPAMPFITAGLLVGIGIVYLF
jgi:presenilin-like A22 family membrane protease